MANRTLKGAEFNYFTTELELLAIVWALMKFRTFLLDAEILIETDQKALCYLLTCRFLNSRLTRWRLAIQDYDFKIKYIEGPRNYIADTLSRIPEREIQKEIKNIKKAQRDEEKINRLINKIESGSRHREFLKVKTNQRSTRTIWPYRGIKMF